jgi:hypothetical protein
MPNDKKRWPAGQCPVCLGWGPLTQYTCCAACSKWRRAFPGQAACLRCSRVTHVDRDGICRPCLMIVRDEDPGWILRPQPGRPLQLGFLLNASGSMPGWPRSPPTWGAGQALLPPGRRPVERSSRLRRPAHRHPGRRQRARRGRPRGPCCRGPRDRRPDRLPGGQRPTADRHPLASACRADRRHRRSRPRRRASGNHVDFRERHKRNRRAKCGRANCHVRRRPSHLALTAKRRGEHNHRNGVEPALLHQPA